MATVKLFYSDSNSTSVSIKNLINNAKNTDDITVSNGDQLRAKATLSAHKVDGFNHADPSTYADNDACVEANVSEVCLVIEGEASTDNCDNTPISQTATDDTVATPSTTYVPTAAKVLVITEIEGLDNADALNELIQTV